MSKITTMVVIGSLMLVIISLLFAPALKPPITEAYAGSPPAIAGAVLVVEVLNGSHGSIWKFEDDNRECYVNSSGGIWCTP
jgi:hypothetical protein